MKNNKTFRTIILHRFLDVPICLGLFLLISYIIDFALWKNYFGVIWLLILCIPVIFFLIYTEYFINYRIIREVELLNNGFILIYKRKRQIIYFKNIIKRQQGIEFNLPCIIYYTNYNNKFYFSGKKGVILSLIFDDNIFKKIDENYCIYYKCR